MSATPLVSKTPVQGQPGQSEPKASTNAGAPSGGVAGVANITYKLDNGQILSPANKYFGISPSVGVRKGDAKPAPLGDKNDVLPGQ